MADIEHVHTHESIDTTNTDDKASGSASNVVHPFEEEVTEVLPQRSRLRKFAILVALNVRPRYLDWIIIFMSQYLHYSDLTSCSFLFS